MAPAANMFGRSRFFFHEKAACCYIGVNLGNGLDHNFLSHLTDGTPRSSSDLLYFTLLGPFTRTNYSKSNSLSPSYSLGQKHSMPDSSSFFSSDKLFLSQNALFSLLFLDENILSPTPNPQEYSKSHFPSDLQKFPLFVHLFYTLATGV